jgi:hypothetical protein
MWWMARYKLALCFAILCSWGSCGCWSACAWKTSRTCLGLRYAVLTHVGFGLTWVRCARVRHQVIHHRVVVGVSRSHVLVRTIFVLQVARVRAVLVHGDVRVGKLVVLLVCHGFPLRHHVLVFLVVALFVKGLRVKTAVRALEHAHHAARTNLDCVVVAVKQVADLMDNRTVDE